MCVLEIVVWCMKMDRLGEGSTMAVVVVMRVTMVVMTLAVVVMVVTIVVVLL